MDSLEKTKRRRPEARRGSWWWGFGLTLAALFVLPVSSAWAQPTSTEMVEMRDGVHLATDLYLPTAGSGPWPVVLQRTPYNKDDMHSQGNAFSQNGVVAVIQDTRGKFASEGTDCVFLCDGAGALQDGYDTLTWIDNQTWSDGHVVTVGGSALGIVQYMQATTGPPGLQAMVVAVGTPSFYQHALFPGGVFRESLIEGWLEGQGSLFFLDELAQHTLLDSYYDSVETEDQYGDIQVPAIHIGGWYDIFGQGTLDAFTGYQAQGGQGAQGKQKLIMGPWTHGIFNTTAGELTYPSNAGDIPGGFEDMQLLWLAHYLGMAPNEAAVDAIPAVQYYVMGDVTDPSAPGNEWRSADGWPPEAAPIRFYLQPGGGLSESCPPQSGGESAYLYDPSDPVPTVGGANLLIPAGPMDQAPAVESRGDVLVFTTSELTEPIEITGRVRAHIWTHIDTPDTHLMARLTDVYPDGRSMLLMDGAARLAARGTMDTLTPLSSGEVVEVEVDLWSTSVVINTGHRIRLAISSSNWPRFRASPNDGSSYGGDANPTPVNVHVLHQQANASYVELPNPQRDPSEVTLCHEAPVADGGVSDSGTVDAASGDAATDDAGVQPDASGESPGSGGDGGCSCKAAVGAASSTPLTSQGLWLLLAGLLAAGRATRRRRRCRRRGC